MTHLSMKHIYFNMNEDIIKCFCPFLKKNIDVRPDFVMNFFLWYNGEE